MFFSRSPMTFWATLTLFRLAHFKRFQKLIWCWLVRNLPEGDVMKRFVACTILQSLHRQQLRLWDTNKNISVFPTLVIWLVVLTCFNHLETYEFVNGNHYPNIWNGTQKIFESTNQSLWSSFPSQKSASHRPGRDRSIFRDGYRLFWNIKISYWKRPANLSRTYIFLNIFIIYIYICVLE